MVQVSLCVLAVAWASAIVGTIAKHYGHLHVCAFCYGVGVGLGVYSVFLKWREERKSKT